MENESLITKQNEYDLALKGLSCLQQTINTLSNIAIAIAKHAHHFVANWLKSLSCASYVCFLEVLHCIHVYNVIIIDHFH